MKISIFESEGIINPININIEDNNNYKVCFVIDRRDEIFQQNEFKESDFSIYVAREAFPYSRSDSWITNKSGAFDFIFTTQRSLLTKINKKSYYIPFGSPWCKSLDDHSNLDNKQFSISFMPGKKFMPIFEGHYNRKKVYSALKNNKVNTAANIKLFPPNIWVEKKEEVFDDHQFSIIIDNYASDGW